MIGTTVRTSNPLTGTWRNGSSAMIDDFLQREIDIGSFPSAVYAVGSSSGIEREGALGDAVAVPLRIPATEWGQRFEAKMANRTDLPTRDGLIWGTTHDGNSFHAGGTAGNAGLFATARAVFRLAQAWVNAELLPRAVVDEATRNLTPELAR